MNILPHQTEGLYGPIRQQHIMLKHAPQTGVQCPTDLPMCRNNIPNRRPGHNNNVWNSRGRNNRHARNNSAWNSRDRNRRPGPSNNG